MFIVRLSTSCIIDGILSLQSDDQSEELEEGEWRPEEEEKESYVFADVDEVEEGEIREDPNEEPGTASSFHFGELNVDLIRTSELYVETRLLTYIIVILSTSRKFRSGWRSLWHSQWRRSCS